MREVFAKNSDGAKQCPNARSQKSNVKVLLQNFGWRASLFDFKIYFFDDTTFGLSTAIVNVKMNI